MGGGRVDTHAPLQGAPPDVAAANPYHTGPRFEQMPGAPPAAFGSDYGACFDRAAYPAYPAHGLHASTFDMSHGDRSSGHGGMFGGGGSAAPGKQMFDEKIAQSAQMTYSDDDTEKTHWVKTVRSYLIGRC